MKLEYYIDKMFSFIEISLTGDKRDSVEKRFDRVKFSILCLSFLFILLTLTSFFLLNLKNPWCMIVVSIDIPVFFIILFLFFESFDDIKKEDRELNFTKNEKFSNSYNEFIESVEIKNI